MSIRLLIEGRAPVEITTCDVDSKVEDAIALLADQRIGALPVLEQGKVVGIFSERDVIYQLRRHGSAVLTSRVGDVMTAPAVTVDPETDTLTALSMMTKRRIRHLPVVIEGEMIAFVSIGDLVKNRIERISSEADAMRSYIQMA